MSIKNNTTSLQEVLEIINTLPDAGGVELPELTNEGTASDLLAGKQLIDQEGNIVEGAFSIDDELTTQDNLIAQIQAAADSLPEASEPSFQSKTVTPTTSSQTVTADSGYDGLSKVTVNAMPTATQATPSITVNSSGLITASATQTAGYVSAGTKSATKQLTTQAAQTITPSTADQTIASGRYLTGVQTIKGDANLVASNIKKGVSIFGVSGSLESGSSGGSGSSIDTCSLTISGDFEFIYNSINNEDIVGNSITSPQNKTIIVPCASLVTVHDYQFMGGITEPTQISNMVTIHDGVSTLGLMSVFQVSSVANSECSLIF